ncbi:MAG: arsenate reductase (glutaredoxin) [Bacteroidales bacterium]|nr:arsenate reductase (glutaredoxin) [Bacteroidales bacterium]
MYKIYHNPRCKKSRAGLKYMEDKNVELDIIQYLKTPLSVEELSDIFVKLNNKPSEMIRKQEAIYKSDFKGKSFNEDEWIRIIAQHPKLLNRPIVIGKHKAIWGDPADNLDEFFK